MAGDPRGLEAAGDVEPAEGEGRSRWRGQGQFLGHELCRAIRRLLAGDAASPSWSRRAVARIDAIRPDFPWLGGDESNALLSAGGEVERWTFAGGRANAALAHRHARDLDLRITSDNFAVRFRRGQGLEIIEVTLRGPRGSDRGGIEPPVSDRPWTG